MRAIRHHRYGPPDVLWIEEMLIPVPGPRDVLVEVRGAGVGGGEPAIRQGRLRRVLSGHRLPQGVGVDFTGQVASLGADVEGLSTGDAVWGLMLP